MAGLLVLTHGRLADELVQAAVRIVGPLDNVAAVSIGWDDEAVDARALIEAAMRRIGGDGEILVLTDMFGGTPTNLALSLLEAGKVEVVTGVNLPMVIKFTNLRGTLGLAEIARAISGQGRDAIQIASAILEGRSGPEPDGAA